MKGFIEIETANGKALINVSSIYAVTMCEEGGSWINYAGSQFMLKTPEEYDDIFDKIFIAL